MVGFDLQRNFLTVQVTMPKKIHYDITMFYKTPECGLHFHDICHTIPQGNLEE